MECAPEHGRCSLVLVWNFTANVVVNQERDRRDRRCLYQQNSSWLPLGPGIGTEGAPARLKKPAGKPTKPQAPILAVNRLFDNMQAKTRLLDGNLKWTVLLCPLTIEYLLPTPTRWESSLDWPSFYTYLRTHGQPISAQGPV